MSKIWETVGSLVNFTNCDVWTVTVRKHARMPMKTKFHVVCKHLKSGTELMGTWKIINRFISFLWILQHYAWSIVSKRNSLCCDNYMSPSLACLSVSRSGQVLFLYVWLSWPRKLSCKRHIKQKGKNHGSRSKGVVSCFNFTVVVLRIP